MEGKEHSDKEDVDNEGGEAEEEDSGRQKLRTRTISEGSDTTSGPSKRQQINPPSLVQHNDFFFPGVPASPPKFISLEQIMEAADGLSNMVLAHEIAVNKEFVLEKSEPQTSLEKQIKDIVHKAFWDSFETQLKETPPNYSHAITLLSEIKEGLIAVTLPHHSQLRRQINEALDLQLIQQQVENDALDFEYYSKFILSTMSRLCAPVRDEQIEELVKLTEVVPLFKGILETLELMKLDMANYTIQQIRPHLQQCSIEYERKKFQEFLAALADLTPRVDGLELTRKWLANVYEKATSSCITDGASSSTLQAAQNLSDSDITLKAYIEILQWDNDSLFPEVLQMDQVRYLAIRDQFSNIILTASVLLITYSIVGEAIQGIESLKVKLKDDVSLLLKEAACKSTDELQAILEATGLQVAQEVNKCLAQHGYPELDDCRRSLLLGKVGEISSKDHSVRRLIETRLFEFMENVLKSPNVARVKFPAGLSAFHKELATLAGQFLRLVNHNRAVFGDYFTDILSKFAGHHTG